MLHALTALLLAATVWPKDLPAKDRDLPLGSDEGIARAHPARVVVKPFNHAVAVE